MRVHPGGITLARMNRAVTWTRARGDLVLAVVLTIAALAQAAIAPIAATPVAVLIALATTAPVAVRRTRPVLAALVSTGAGLIPSDGYVYVGYVVAFIVFYSVAVYVPDGRRVVAVVAGGAAIAVAASVIHGAVFGEYFGALSAVVAPAVVGRFVRFHRAQARRLAELTEHLELERERNVARALVDERARIARELHDVVAHTVSVIAIQADAAEAALDLEPARAREPLEVIRRSATDALAEMRRLLAVLRADGEDGELAPQPGLAQLNVLLDRARKLGVSVVLEVTGEARPLPASVDLSVYRIIQEALTNVGKHAGGAPATVRLQWAPHALEVEIRDQGTASKPNGHGHGLVGMRERARIHGGSLTAGPSPEGGFRVHAEMPYSGQA